MKATRPVNSAISAPRGGGSNAAIKYKWLWVCLAGLAGAIALPLLEIARDAIFVPKLLEDGQYILLPAIVLPQGVWLGCGIGSAIILCRQGQWRRALFTLGFFEACLLAVCLAFAWRYPWIEIVKSLGSGIFSVGLGCGLVGLIAIVELSRRRRLPGD